MGATYTIWTTETVGAGDDICSLQVLLYIWLTLEFVLEMILAWFFPLFMCLSIRLILQLQPFLHPLSNEFSSLFIQGIKSYAYCTISLLRSNTFGLIFGFFRISMIFIIVMITYLHGLSGLSNVIFPQSPIIFTE